MSDREKLPEWIDRYNQHTLQGEELEKFLRLLKDNPRLQEEVRLDHDLDESLKDEEALELRKKMRTAGRKYRQKQENGRKDPLRYLLLAAMLVLIAGMAFLLFWYSKAPSYPERNESGLLGDSLPGIPDKNKPHPGKDSATRVTQRMQKDEKLIAENFRSNPAFESLLSATIRNGTFLLLAPKDTVVFRGKSSLDFSWKQEGQDPVEIRIMDNRGRTVAGPVRPVGTAASVTIGSLPAGLYYFKITRNEELVHMGKFKIL